MRRAIVIELTLITLVGLFYFSHFLPKPPEGDVITDGIDLQPLRSALFDPAYRQMSTEHERLVGSILAVRTAWHQFGYIPTWNPYIHNGVPLLNNGFNYLFNPFHSLPVLLLGPEQGSKLATLIALLIAGYAMWTFGLALGFGSLARVAMGVFYLMSGGIAAKFGAGHFQLACSLAWVPLVLAGFWWTLTTPHRRAVILTAVAFALLFYAGNIYYALHTALSCGVILLVHLYADWSQRQHYLRRSLIAGAFAFGLSALLFFPIWTTRTFVSHEPQTFEPDGSLSRSYSLTQSFINLIYPWNEWYELQAPDFSGLIAAVDYNYLGLGIFLLIGLGLLVHLAAQRTQSPDQPAPFPCITVSALIMCGMMMFWATGQPPLNLLYAAIPLLSEFRFLGRALAIAALWWVVLAGLSIDLIWRTARTALQTTALADTIQRVRLWRMALVACLIWGFWLIYSISPITTRLGLVLNNRRLRLNLDDWRWTSWADAAGSLVLLLIIVILLDALLLGLWRKALLYLWPEWIPRYGIHATSTYLLRAGLLILLLLIGHDLLWVNRLSLHYDQYEMRLNAVYEAVSLADTGSMIPSIFLPETPLAFAGYEAGIRNWFLDEGWQPAALPDVINRSQDFNNLPRWWAIYATAPPEAKEQMIQQGYSLFGSYNLRVPASDLPIEAELYQADSRLPHAFVVAEAPLSADPNLLRSDTVLPVETLLRQPDALVLQASAPDDGTAYYLVVQENNFPGWQVTVNGESVMPRTVQTFFIRGQSIGLMAVPMRPGDHVYSLHFVPPGWTAGLVVFGLTLLTLLIFSFHRLHFRR